jgi:hypothetical protein
MKNIPKYSVCYSSLDNILAKPKNVKTVTGPTVLSSAIGMFNS